MNPEILLSLFNGPPLMLMPLGQTPPRFSDGIATWTKVPRPRRKSLTTFTGEEPWTLTLEVMLDQFPNGDVEGGIALLEGKAVRPGNMAQPEILRLSGPIAHTDLPWVLTTIDDSGEVQRRDDGRRCRQQLTLTFMEYVANELVVRSQSPAQAAAAAADSGQSGGGSSQRTYTVVSGDTLSGIAQKLYNDSGKWQSIADANGMRDPRSLRVGQVLRIP